MRQKSKRANGHFEKESQIKTSEERNLGGENVGDEGGRIGNQSLSEGSLHISEEQLRLIDTNRQIAFHRRARKFAEQDFDVELQALAAKQSKRAKPSNTEDGSEAKQASPKEVGGHEAGDKGFNENSAAGNLENESPENEKKR